MKSALVMTTINPPLIARDFCANFDKFGHKADASIIVIGDKKSVDADAQAICADLKAKGFDVQYYGIADQEKWLTKYPKFGTIIPYNSDNRRNVGYLMAKEQGAEVIVSVDDDNFPLPDVDFLGGHTELLGKTVELPVCESPNRWFNICSLLANDGGRNIFPRGFPYYARTGYPSDAIKISKKAVPVMLNEGLWVSEPDTDAITHLEHSVRITGFREGAEKRVALELGTFSPINSQNTAFHVSLLPAYYFVLMGEKIEGLPIDRYGDIWQGLFMKKVMDVLGQYAAFGTPLADHRRNPHNFFKDLKFELNGIVYTETIGEFLEKVELKGSNSAEVYADLAEKLRSFILNEERFPADLKAYEQKIYDAQMIWLDTLEKISS